MKKVTSHLKRVFLGVLIAALFWTPGNGFTEDFSLPHHFEPGETISADVINEILDYIRDSHRKVSMSELIGTWTGTSYGDTKLANNLPVPTDPWVLSVDGKYYSLPNITVTFADDGDGTFSLTTSDPNPFYVQTSGAPPIVNWPFEMVDDSIFYPGGVYSIERRGPNRLLLRDNSSDGWQQRPNLVILNRSDLPPLNPSVLSYSTNVLTINLTWTDNSTEETGFKILRKSRVSDPYVEIATVAADVTYYGDKVSAPADFDYGFQFWYRVFATSANGDSLGSNAIRVEIAYPDLFSVAGAGQDLVLTWRYEGPEPTAFLIQRRILGDLTFADIISVDGTETTYRDTPPDSQWYEYQIVATYPSGEDIPGNIRGNKIYF